MRRSQVILRMPVDSVEATVILHDGDRSEATLFIPPTEVLSQLLASGPQFLPMIRGGKMQLVARAAIACIGVRAANVVPAEDDLPVEIQPAMVQLRGGTQLVGDLKYVAPPGQARTADFLNGDGDSFELHTPEVTFHVVKAHVALVEER